MKNIRLFFNIIGGDVLYYISIVGIIFPAVIYLITEKRSEEFENFIMMCSFWALSIPLFLYKSYHIFLAIKNGIIIDGKVLMTGNAYKGLIEAQFEYEIDGKTFRQYGTYTKHYISDSGRIKLLINKNDPEDYYMI